MTPPLAGATPTATRPDAAPATPTTLWAVTFAVTLPTGFALCLYWLTAAPGLTWAHFGADGGDLIAAAQVNGVPHPSGYPLYTLLLQGWLALGRALSGPAADPAWWGNRLSALCMAASVGLTALTLRRLLPSGPVHLIWAALGGLLWAVAPLPWSQAVITEVYALHALLAAALGWLALRPQTPAWLLGALMGAQLAHHLTSMLLWPAALYLWFTAAPRPRRLRQTVILGGALLTVALLGYARLPWVAQYGPPPVAWGYPRDLAGLWWVISGAAYQDYLFALTPAAYAARAISLVRFVADQLTLGGLVLLVVGLAQWAATQPQRRTAALLWMLPGAAYAAGYATVDSQVYLLPGLWWAALTAIAGLAAATAWLTRRTARPWLTGALPALTGIVLLTLVALRLPAISLRDDQEARVYLAESAAALEPGSLILSSADAATFALWYGQWGSGALAAQTPDLVMVNYALYQFGWYRNLMHDLYPNVPGMGEPLATLLAANAAQRPIFVTEPLPGLPPAELTPVGPLWRWIPVGP